MFLQPTFQLTYLPTSTTRPGLLSDSYAVSTYTYAYTYAYGYSLLDMRLQPGYVWPQPQPTLHMVAGPASFDAGVDACNSILMPQNAELYHTRLVQMCRFYPAASQRQEQHYT